MANPICEMDAQRRQRSLGAVADSELAAAPRRRGGDGRPAGDRAGALGASARRRRRRVPPRDDAGVDRVDVPQGDAARRPRRAVGDRRRGDDDRGARRAPHRPSSPSRSAAPPPTPAQLAALEALQQEADAYEKRRAGLPRHRHDDHQAPLRGEEEGDPLRPRPRNRHREGRSSRRRARPPSSASRTSSPSTAAPNAQPEATPDAMYRLAALYEERARSDDDDRRRSRDRPQARDRALQARHQRVPEVPRARGHLLLPRPRAQRLAAASTRRSRCGARSSATTTSRTRRRPIRRTRTTDTIVADPAGSRRGLLDGVARQVPRPEVAQRRAEAPTRRLRRSVSGTTARSIPQPDAPAGRGAEVRRRNLVADRQLGVRPARLRAAASSRKSRRRVWDYNRAASAYRSR